MFCSVFEFEHFFFRENVKSNNKRRNNLLRDTNDFSHRILNRMGEAGGAECEGKKIVKTEERKLSKQDFDTLTRL